ncbi:unnamed protein product [Cochlearia groenlandica]
MKLRLTNIVSDWKDKWRVSGDTARPSILSIAVWDGCSKEERANYRVGSILDVPLVQPSCRSATQMEAEIQTLHQKQTETENTFAYYNSLFSVIYSSNPELQHIMQTDPNRPTQPPSNTVDHENATRDYFEEDVDFDLGNSLGLV